MAELWSHFAAAFRRENYARMGGRATRAEYWSCMLFAFLFSLLPLGMLLAGGVLCLLLPAAGMVLLLAGAAAMLFYVFYTALPMLAVYVRRLHDVGWSGRWIALQYAIVAVMMVLETGLLLQFQLEQEILITDLADMDPVQLVGLAQDFSASLPAWWRILCSITDPLLTLLGLLLFVLTLLPSKKG